MLQTLRLPIPNVYLLTGERSILIDAGAPTDVRRILAFLKSQHAANLALILLTHGHWDHAGGAAELRQRTKAPIAMHRADVELVRLGTVPPHRTHSVMGWFIRRFIDRPFPTFEPDLLLDEEMSLEGFGVDARVLHTPGHSAGSISVLTAEGDAVVGDLLLGGWFGGKLFGSWPGLHYFAEDIGQVQASIGKLLAASPKRILPGHGGPLDPAAVMRRLAAIKSPGT